LIQRFKKQIPMSPNMGIFFVTGTTAGGSSCRLWCFEGAAIPTEEMALVQQAPE
jgi:hypothetical protein